MSFFQKKKKNKSAKGMFSKKLFGGAFSNKLFEGGAFTDFFLGNEDLHSSLFSGDKELEKVLDGELVVGEGSTGGKSTRIENRLQNQARRITKGKSLIEY
jgi:hypothetical protein